MTANCVCTPMRLENRPVAPALVLFLPLSCPVDGPIARLFVRVDDMGAEVAFKRMATPDQWIRDESDCPDHSPA